jgi:L-lactate utilization protein LutC
VVGARWGIAATGTVVVDAARAGTRTASLLPPAVVVLLERDRILADSAELFRRLGARFADGLPSQFALLTGPSRSADIELEITIGVHGPGRMVVVILP